MTRWDDEDAPRAKQPRTKPDPSRWEDPKFLALKREWDAKLAADGFVDVEVADPSLRSDRRDLFEFDKLNRVRRREASGSAEVYRFAEQWLQEARFRLRIDRIALLLWSEGRSLPDQRVWGPFSRDPQRRLYRVLPRMLETMRARGDACADELAAEIEAMSDEFMLRGESV